MKIYENPKYLEDIEYAEGLPLPWEKIEGSSFLISGATGLIGSFITDVLIRKGCTIYALSRDLCRARQRFSYCADKIRLISHDINTPLVSTDIYTVDYVLHLASNTHPAAYAADPIGTITTNIIGTQNMLEFAASHNALRCVFASSNEIYGENRGDTELFTEDYCGYIDPNTMRAGYPESKRCGEAMCQAYIKQRGLDIVIPRFTRSYGPTMRSCDTKAVSQFIHSAAEGKDIVLKSAGTQYYSYTYAADAAAGLFTVLLCGKNGEAYNIADEKSDIRLRDLAAMIAAKSGQKVVFELPDEAEAAGYSKATKARLDGGKIKELGWNAKYDIASGVRRTIDILKEIK